MKCLYDLKIYLHTSNFIIRRSQVKISPLEKRLLNCMRAWKLFWSKAQCGWEAL